MAMVGNIEPLSDLNAITPDGFLGTSLGAGTRRAPFFPSQFCQQLLPLGATAASAASFAVCGTSATGLSKSVLRARIVNRVPGATEPISRVWAGEHRSFSAAC